MNDSCSLFEQIDLNQALPIGDKLRLHALKNSVPLNVTMEITHRCNFHCPHCYNFDRTQNNQSPQESEALKTKEIFSVIDQLKAAGTFYFCLTGGEVLIHPDLLSIVSHASATGLVVRLKSNASLLTELKAQELKAAGVSEIEFSLYGGTSFTHERFTGSKGTFEQVLAGIKNAKISGLNPKVNIILHKYNVSEYEKMLAHLKFLDVPFDVSMDLTARHDASMGSLDYRLEVEDLLTLFKTTEGKKLIPGKNHSGNVQCACARSNCGIAINGDVYPCIGNPMKAGNIREKSFSEIWQNSEVFAKIRGLTPKDFKDCFSCDDQEYCQRSSGLVYLNTGDYTGSEQSTCEKAALFKKLNQV